MRDQIQRKQLLASLKSECKEDQVLDRSIGKAVLKTYQLSLDSKIPPRSKLEGAKAQSKATETRLKLPSYTITAAYSECHSESPLKGTPWEDAGFRSVSLASPSCSPRKNRRLTRQSNAKDEESIAEFWKNFFG